MTATRATRILGGLAALGLVAGLLAAFVVAPREATQGNVRKCSSCTNTFSSTAAATSESLSRSP